MDAKGTQHSSESERNRFLSELKRLKKKASALRCQIEELDAVNKTFEARMDSCDELKVRLCCYERRVDQLEEKLRERTREVDSATHTYRLLRRELEDFNHSLCHDHHHQHHHGAARGERQKNKDRHSAGREDSFAARLQQTNDERNAHNALATHSEEDRDRKATQKEIRNGLLIKSNLEEKDSTKRKEETEETAEEDLFPVKPSGTAPPLSLPHPSPPHAHEPTLHDGTTAFPSSSSDAPTQRLPLDRKQGKGERASRRGGIVPEGGGVPEGGTVPEGGIVPEGRVGQVRCVDTGERSPSVAGPFPHSASYTVITETSSPKPTMTSPDIKSTQLNCDRKSRCNSNSHLSSVRISEVHSRGKYIRIVNSSECKEEDLGDHFLLQRYHDTAFAVFRFPACVVLPPQGSTTVWSAEGATADCVAHSPPTDLVAWSQPVWAAGPDCITILCRPNEQALSWISSKGLHSSRSDCSLRRRRSSGARCDRRPVDDDDCGAYGQRQPSAGPSRAGLCPESKDQASRRRGKRSQGSSPSRRSPRTIGGSGNSRGCRGASQTRDCSETIISKRHKAQLSISNCDCDDDDGVCGGRGKVQKCRDCDDDDDDSRDGGRQRGRVTECIPCVCVHLPSQRTNANKRNGSREVSDNCQECRQLTKTSGHSPKPECLCQIDDCGASTMSRVTSYDRKRESPPHCSCSSHLKTDCDGGRGGRPEQRRDRNCDRRLKKRRDYEDTEHVRMTKCHEGGGRSKGGSGLGKTCDEEDDNDDDCCYDNDRSRTKSRGKRNEQMGNCVSRRRSVCEKRKRTSSTCEEEDDEDSCGGRQLQQQQQQRGCSSWSKWKKWFGDLASRVTPCSCDCRCQSTDDGGGVTGGRCHEAVHVTELCSTAARSKRLKVKECRCCEEPECQCHSKKHTCEEQVDVKERCRKPFARIKHEQDDCPCKEDRKRQQTKEKTDKGKREDCLASCSPDGCQDDDDCWSHGNSYALTAASIMAAGVTIAAIYSS